MPFYDGSVDDVCNKFTVDDDDDALILKFSTGLTNHEMLPLNRKVDRLMPFLYQ